MRIDPAFTPRFRGDLSWQYRSRIRTRNQHRPHDRYDTAPARRRPSNHRFDEGPIVHSIIPSDLLRLGRVISMLCLILSQPLPVRAEPQAKPDAGTGAATPEIMQRPSANTVCRALVQAATDNELPIEFFTRLIWQESRFNPGAVSPKGAAGIAQFMPRTAAERGLADPFEPLQALRESASYLRELRTTFRGNLGLPPPPITPDRGGSKPGSRVAAACRVKPALTYEPSRVTPPTPGHQINSASFPRSQGAWTARSSRSSLQPDRARLQRRPSTRRGDPGACSSRAIGRRDRFWPLTNGFAAGTIPFFVTTCPWSFVPRQILVAHQSISSAFLKRVGRVPTPCVPGCMRPGVPASFCAILLADHCVCFSDKPPICVLPRNFARVSPDTASAPTRLG